VPRRSNAPLAACIVPVSLIYEALSCLFLYHILSTFQFHAARYLSVSAFYCFHLSQSDQNRHPQKNKLNAL
jgi:hypothetical protein